MMRGTPYLDASLLALEATIARFVMRAPGWHRLLVLETSVPLGMSPKLDVHQCICKVNGEGDEE